MPSRFIPAFHFVPASEKISSEWANDVINYCYYNSNIKNLLHGKNIEEIEGYATGDFSLKPFKRMFRSLRQQQQAEQNPNIPKEYIANMDITGIQWTQIPLIPTKLNSAIATYQKIPIEITATCQDPLAQKKKKEDLEFIRNKNKMVEFLQPLYDSMNLGDADVGATKHSSVPFTGMPLDLDVDNEEEFRIFADLIYNLAPESSFETILQQFYEFKKVRQIKLLETTDQLYFGVSSHLAYADKNTDLPNIEYVHPSSIETDSSVLPDYSDNTIRIITHSITPFELFKFFPDEICDEDKLFQIMNNKGEKGDPTNGYCQCNSRNNISKGDFGSFKINLKYIEVKSVDSAMIAERKGKYGSFKYFTNDEKKCVGKVWGQNTYCFYWLPNTKWFFGIDRLGFAYRSKGKEVYTSFSTNIYKSQTKSAVEHCIGENKKAQMADIKLQHSIIMSTPPGKIIDMKYIRNAIEGLTEEMSHYTAKDLLNYAMEHNIHMIDSEGYENKQIGQFVPVKDLPGGLKEDILGYYKVIFEAKKNISEFTGINDQLTGVGANPEGLVGLQKLLINSSINALNYINEAIISQYQSLFNIWAWHIKNTIEKGGAGRQAIENLIGTRKVDIIDGLDEVPLHQIGIKITLGQREEERAVFKNEVAKMRQAGILNAADEYFILNTSNPKDSMWMIAVKENKFLKRQEKQKAAQIQSLQQMKETEGQNMLANTQAQTEGKIKQISASGEVEGKLMTLGSRLGLSEKQLDSLIKRQLQDARIDKQTEKSLKTISANKDAKIQEAMT